MNPFRPRAAALVLAVVAAIGLIAPVTSPATAAPGYTQTSGVPFEADGPFTAPIPANPDIDPKSAGMLAPLTGGTCCIANLYAYGIPIYHATWSDPLYNVNCTKPWGPCPFDHPVRVPAGAAPHTGSDKAMVIIDWTNNTSYEFWLVTSIGNGQINTGWGGYTDIHGTGNGVNSTGAEISRIAGVVRTHEIANGHIPHPLVFSTTTSCDVEFRWPATKTDGWSTDPYCLPEGARIQLDPSINVDAIPGISAGEKTVAKALQTYGAYNIDNGGAPMAFSFETPTGSDPYPGAGFGWDWYYMSKIPWGSMRVLSDWQPPGTTTTTTTTARGPTTTTTTLPPFDLFADAPDETETGPATEPSATAASPPASAQGNDASSASQAHAAADHLETRPQATTRPPLDRLQREILRQLRRHRWRSFGRH